jgi:hypothetical protein
MGKIITDAWKYIRMYLNNRTVSSGNCSKQWNCEPLTVLYIRTDSSIQWNYPQFTKALGIDKRKTAEKVLDLIHYVLERYGDGKKETNERRGPGL